MSQFRRCLLTTFLTVDSNLTFKHYRHLVLHGSNAGIPAFGVHVLAVIILITISFECCVFLSVVITLWHQSSDLKVLMAATSRITFKKVSNNPKFDLCLSILNGTKSNVRLLDPCQKVKQFVAAISAHLKLHAVNSILDSDDSHTWMT